jgi:hypothetical protein
MREEMLNKFLKSRFFYPSLISLIWLIVYILCQLILDQKLGWDEVSYMSVAKGIATDFDFSSRAYTIMGLLKHGYPSHLINYPISSLYIAIFFKLFGCSLKIAYFSSWIAALGVSILIFYIFKLLFPASSKLAFIIAISYLLYPGILKNIDSAMMEQLGNFLMMLSIYLIFKDYVKGVFNWTTLLKLSFSLLILWLYKTLFIGIFFGFFVLLLFISFYKSEQKIDFKIKPLFFIPFVYVLFAILFYICQKFIFLPVAPMMNFTPEKEAKQIYSDFLGGFFLDFPENLIINLNNFVGIIKTYFIYPSPYTEPNNQFFVFIPFIIITAQYFFILLIVFITLFAIWKSLESIQKAFMIFSLISIFSFNLIFNCLFTTTYENIWRYNLYYLPIFLLSLGVIIKGLKSYIKPFCADHKVVSCLILALIVIGVYLPPTLSILKTQVIFYDQYHNLAKTNALLVSEIIKNDKPKFIYLNDGTHTSFVSYPTIQIFKDATNDQLKQVNKILPEPISFLFLRQRDWLFEINKEQILKGLPILDGAYTFYTFEPTTRTVIYRYRG